MIAESKCFIYLCWLRALIDHGATTPLGGITPATQSYDSAPHPIIQAAERGDYKAMFDMLSSGT